MPAASMEWIQEDVGNAAKRSERLMNETDMKEFIYNQNQIPDFQWRYGFRASAATGCGWIATYNALRLMDRYKEPETLIRYYWGAFPVVNGTFGTLILSIIWFFRQRGFRVRLVVRRSKFDEAIRDGDACILRYWWCKACRIGTHYAALACRNGRITGYNTFRNSRGPDDYGVSLQAFIKRQGFFWPMLIVIRNDSQTE